MSRSRISQPANINQRNEAGVVQVKKALLEKGFTQAPYEKPFQVFVSPNHIAKTTVKISPIIGECVIDNGSGAPNRYSNLEYAAEIIKSIK